jgi:hypothetical protein
MGTSIQVGEGDGLYRFHIHVPIENKRLPEEYAERHGVVLKAAYENLMEQVKDQQPRTARRELLAVNQDQIAVVAVAPGPGIADVFASLHASAIVEGGQTMNPSTQEIIAAFDNLPTKRVIILPNNKNIILAAKTAAELNTKQIAVIPSRSVPQGLAAMMRFAPDGDFDEVVADMTAALDQVETGEVTIATRTVEIDGVAAREGQYIALHNGRLALAADGLAEATLRLLEVAHADHFEILTLFHGSDLSRAEADRIKDLAQQAYPNMEVELHEGGQPHYFFIISIE